MLMFRCISGDKLPLLVISAVSGSYREADVGTARVGRRKEGKREEVGGLSVEDDGIGVELEAICICHVRGRCGPLPALRENYSRGRRLQD